MTTCSSLRALALVATLVVSSVAHAQLFRSYLAIDGNDANPCTLPAPCRLLPAALAAVADGGEIWLLDSANYNTATVVIEKSVSILAVPGAKGSVVAINQPLGGGGVLFTPAIRIQAAGLEVSLRNLVLVPYPGSGSGTSGVEVAGASQLTIEDSVIENMPMHGISVFGAGTLRIANLTIRNNGYAGVHLQDGARAQISGTRLLGNAISGLVVLSTAGLTTTATLSDSVVSGGSAGVSASTITGGDVAQISVTATTIEGATYGLISGSYSNGAPSLTLSRCMIANNSHAWKIEGASAVIETLGNNHIARNANASTGSLTPISVQ